MDDQPNEWPVNGGECAARSRPRESGCIEVEGIRMDVYIRSVAREDVPFVQTFCAMASVSELTSIPHPYPVDGARQWFHQVTNNARAGVMWPWTIVCDDQFAGIIALKRPEPSTGAVDYWVAPPFWGQGVATRAVGCVVRHAWDQGLQILRSYCLSSNVASRKVLEKNGFILIREAPMASGKHAGQAFAYYGLRLDSAD